MALLKGDCRRSDSDKDSWQRAAKWPLVVAGLAAGAGLASTWRSYAAFRRDFVPVLAYHALTDDAAERHDFIVWHKRFEQQMRWLAEHGYRAVTCSELTCRHSLPRRSVAITFDDGFASVHQLALPVVRELDLRATIFITTDYVGHETRFPWPYAAKDPPLSWQQVEELRGAGFEIGSHAVSHRPLPQLSDIDLERELCDSSCVIQSTLGTKPSMFAYPHGSFDRRVMAAVARAGYAAGFAILALPADAGRYSIPRILVRNQTSMLGYRLRLWGLHPFVKSRPLFGLARPWLRRWRWAFL